MGLKRIVVVESDGGAPAVRGVRTPSPGEVITAGRGGELRVGIEPPDPKVSRTALTVTATGEGWRLSASNRNGVDVYPWGQPGHRLADPETLAWPRIGLRINGRTGYQHWILLEDALSPGGFGALPRRPTTTERDEPPRPLTTAQAQVLRLLFGELLTWPPTVPAGCLQLKQVAARSGLGVRAVQERLRQVVGKAERLGLARTDVPLTDPEYLYVLVRAGYVRPVTSDVAEYLREHRAT